MKTRVWWSLAKGVVLESLRRKDLWVIAILGFLIIAAAGALGFFGISGLETFAKDLSVTVLGMFSTMVAILIGRSTDGSGSGSHTVSTHGCFTLPTIHQPSTRKRSIASASGMGSTAVTIWMLASFRITRVRFLKGWVDYVVA